MWLDEISRWKPAGNLACPINKNRNDAPVNNPVP